MISLTGIDSAKISTATASYFSSDDDAMILDDSGNNSSSLTSALTELSLMNFTLDDWYDNSSAAAPALGGNDSLASDCDAILEDKAGPPPVYSDTATLGISIVLLLVPLLTMFGNTVTILAVLTHRKLRTKTNAFIVSLTIADMCVSLLVMPFGIYQQMNNKVWLLGDIVCRLSSSFDVMICTVSIFHLSCLAIDRYLAICHPFLHERLTMRMIVGMLVFCWVTPVFISFIPIMNGWNHIGIEDYIQCAFPPEAHACNFIVNLPFAIICSLIAFYVPVVFMGVCNVQIYMAATRQAHQIRTLEEAGSHNHLSHSKRKKFHHEAKAAKTLGIIMGCFSVCWFPFFIFNIIDPIVGYRIPYIPWMVALWLGYINSMMNPVLYFFFNRHFNHAFCRLLRCKVCKGVPDYDEEIMTGINNTSAMTTRSNSQSSHHRPSQSLHPSSAILTLPLSSSRHCSTVSSDGIPYGQHPNGHNHQQPSAPEMMQNDPK